MQSTQSSKFEVVDPQSSLHAETSRAIERTPTPTWAERLGTALGYALAPVAAFATWARDARAFHPHGGIYHGKVESIAEGALVPLGERLAGSMILRFSTALWNNDREWPDNLGLAIRLRHSPIDSSKPADEDQDLLFVTARSFMTLPLGFVMTNAHDYLANDYYAIAPFDVPGVGICTLRVVSSRPTTSGTSRERRLAGAIRTGDAILRMELQRRGSSEWEPLARLRLLPPAPVVMDDRALRFSPFLDGRGIVPRGFVQAVRRGVYAGSQWLEWLRQQRLNPLTATVSAN